MSVRRDTRGWLWLAVISMIALLFSFERVVRLGVEQGAARHAAERERTSASWRCNELPGQKARADCRTALR